MTLDEDYSTKWICSESGKELDDEDFFISDSECMCNKCGELFTQNTDLGVHMQRSVGKWNRPSLLEWCQGKRAIFILKGTENA